MEINTTQHELTTWVLVLSALAFFISIYLEFKRGHSTQRLLLRSMMIIIMIGSILAIYFKPSIESEVSKDHILLLTPGYDQNTVDSVANEVEEIIHADSLSNSELNHMVSSNNLLITGVGLEKHEVDRFRKQKDSNNQIEFLTNDFNIEGLRTINYNDQLYRGDSLIISGTYSSKQSSKIHLNLLSKNKDSVSLKPGLNEFELKTKVTTTGDLLVYLNIANQKDTISVPLAIHVKEKPTHRILFINAFPTFEMNYLNKFLSEQGHQVAVRSQISKEKFKYEYYNMERISLSRLNQTTLEKFDLVVADPESIKSIESTLLDNLVTAGLGIFIIPDENFLSDNVFFGNNEVRKVLADKEELTIHNQRAAVSTHAFRFNSSFSSLTAFNQTVIVNRKGAGFIGTTALSQTYSLLLKGNESQYQVLWNDIISYFLQLEKKTKIKSDLNPIKDYPWDFIIEGVNELERLTIQGLQIPFIQDPHLPGLYTARYWPREEGWNEVIVNQDTVPFYVSNISNWKTVLDYQRFKYNKRYFNDEVTYSEEVVEKQVLINPLWFFVLFIISVSYLWLEPKLK